MKRFTSKNQQIGKIGEDAAASYLSNCGYNVVDRNVSGRYGEIDIVATKNGIYYFFEVKTGKQGSWLNPAENVTKEKLRKVMLSVQYYALIHSIKQYEVRGILVFINTQLAPVRIEEIELW